MKILESYITVDRLRVFARHGVFPQETTVGNEFEVSVTLSYDAERAASTDDLDAAISYADVVEVIKEEMKTPSKLLEHVAWRIANAITRRFQTVTAGSVTVTKMRPPMNAELSGASFTLKW